MTETIPYAVWTENAYEFVMGVEKAQNLAGEWDQQVSGDVWYAPLVGDQRVQVESEDDE